MIVTYKILLDKGFNLPVLLKNDNGKNSPISGPLHVETIKDRFNKDRINNIKLVLKHYPSFIKVTNNEINETRYNVDNFIGLLAKFAPVTC